MEEYLTTAELASRIKMTPGAIRNLIWRKELKKGVHYLKPTPRKLLFVWSEMELWLRYGTANKSIETNQAQSLINI